MCETNDPAPLTMPTPPSNGPWTNPSKGFSNKSFTPVPILLNNPTGFPKLHIVYIYDKFILFYILLIISLWSTFL